MGESTISKMAPFNIISYNCEGVKRSSNYIADLLQTTKCDILCLQELWVLDSNINYLSTIHRDYEYYGISGVDANIKILCGRPKGGVAILYKKSLSRYVEHIKLENRRMCAIKLNMANNFSCIVFNVYLPCDSFSNNVACSLYTECIDYIEGKMSSLDSNSFICCGDFNTCFTRLNAHCRYLQDFISRNNLLVSWDHVLSKQDYTYVNHALGHRSIIDHFITSRIIYDCIVENEVIFECTNPSSHNPIELQFSSINSIVQSPQLHFERESRCAWEKASKEHINNYQTTLTRSLSAIEIDKHLLCCTNVKCMSTQHRDSIDNLCKCIIDCCLTAGVECIPLTKSNAKTTPGWNPQVKHEREQSLFWHWIWVEAGKPYDGLIYDIMKRTRHVYHYSVRRLRKNKTNIQKQRLADSVSDSKTFWKNINNLNPANNSVPNTIDKVHGACEISKIFLQKYKSLYTSVPSSDHELNVIHDKLDQSLVNITDCIVTPNVIASCISRLKKNKSDGSLGFSSNHIIYGCHKLNVLLSLLFNSMLVHGYFPKELLKSTIISIPKDRSASLANSDNYRGISLFNSMCKLFDYVTIKLCDGKLDTSDMQFGFKQQHSTSMCTLVLREVVDHYLEGNSNVYCCLLDASKAFDKVHYGKLFTMLLTKQISPCILRLLINSYVRQEACVAWDSYKSEYFKQGNGVKQGGVLSPILFTMYIDSLLVTLKDSGYGCHINKTFMGALSYADDITLLSPSLTGLNAMLKMCAIFALEFNITFNSKKSLCIKFGNKLSGNETAKLDNSVISWVDNIKHLGNYIDTTRTDVLDCRRKISEFTGYVNKLIANFGHLQDDILCTLFNTYCCSYYGSQIWRLDSIGFNNVCTSWNKAIRRLIQLPYTTHRWILGPLTNQCHISLQLYRRCVRFLYSMSQSSNLILHTCFTNAVHNANTSLGYNIAFFRHKYGIDISTLSIQQSLCKVCVPKVLYIDYTGEQLKKDFMLSWI